MKFKLLFPLIILVHGLTSCKKEQQPAKNKITDIYIAGWINNKTTGSNAAYWKNGELVTLKSGSNSSFIKAIAVQGNDVYAAGNSWNTNAGGYKITFWKNSVATAIGDSLATTYVRDIAVNGNDVYILGDRSIPNATNTGFVTVSTIWKNKVPTDLPMDGLKYAGSSQILVKGNDVYVTGYLASPQMATIAVVWKNNQVIKLSDSKKSAIAEAITAQGNDIYVAGLGASSKYSVGLVWKNMAAADSLVNPSAPHMFTGYITGIAVDGSNVYVAGLDVDNSSAVNAFHYLYWKNGVIPPSNSVYASNGIFSGRSRFFKNDLYTAGNIAGSYAGYWKNQDPVKITDTPSGANDILIVEHE